MVKNRQPLHARAGQPIREVPFTAPVGVPTGVEVMSFDLLRSRLPSRSLVEPQRPSFHHLLAPSRGVLRHSVDFTEYAAAPGTWLWVRPGQVQQWDAMDGTEGTAVFFEADFLDTVTTGAARLDDPYAPVALEPDEEDGRALRLAREHLAREWEGSGRLPLAVHTATVRHLLAVLVLRLAHLDHPAGGPPAEPDDTFLRFRDAVEDGFTRSRRVEDYARLLGYSPRTLTRAATAGAGVGAKEFIDRRIVLEAKRLLAHGDQSAVQISQRLGFSSATNFSKYFHQRTGQSPIAFRTAVRPRHPGRPAAGTDEHQLPVRPNG
ncbi:helix-turn-helix transcriptional regulator [Streptomyces sp. NPDC059918]|uniref:helix-turn-helix transcriptional regulator n=1 Tax=unclassified Streptomyces TaxID=2593676 RepID=UPI00365FB2DD